MDIVINVIIGVFSALLGFILNIYYQRLRRPDPFQRVTGINTDDHVVIVLPYREPNSSQVQPYRNRKFVTFEDMLATNYAERTMTLAGLSDEKIEICDTEQFGKQPDLQNKNVVLICSPKSNRFTGIALELLREKIEGFEVEFQEYEEEKHKKWRILLWGAKYESESYDNEEENDQTELCFPGRGPVNDYALVTRTQNPWNEDAKLIILAGIRGIGTWGAARYLRDCSKKILDHMDGEDFVAPIHVHYNNYKIQKSGLVPRAFYTTKGRLREV